MALHDADSHRAQIQVIRIVNVVFPNLVTKKDEFQKYTILRKRSFEGIVWIQ